jgi:hypothetical protein
MPSNDPIQPSNKNASSHTIRSTYYADSIKQYTSLLIQGFDSPSNMSKDSNTSVHKNEFTDDKTYNASTQEINKNTHSNTTQISAAIISLNSNRAFFIPSDTLSHNNDLRNSEVNEAASVNHSPTSGISANASHTSFNKKIIDSINNRNSLENYFYTNPDSIRNTTFMLATSEPIKELFVKIDSTLFNEHTDTNSVQEQIKTIEVKLNEEKNKKSLFLSRCSFDGYATPALGYIHLSTNGNQESVNGIIKERNKNAATGFGMTTGLRMNYSLTQKIEIGIGFQYSNLNQQSSFPQQKVDSIYNTYQGYTQVDSTYDSTSHHMIYTNHFVVTGTTTNTAISTRIITHTDKFQNISIPIHIAYGYSISNKLSLLTRTSLLINYQTYSVTYLNGIDSTIIGYHSGKNISLGGSFSIGCYYQFSKRYSVFAEPIVSYYFSNVFDKRVLFKQKQLTLGLQTGIRLSF